MIEPIERLGAPPPGRFVFHMRRMQLVSAFTLTEDQAFNTQIATTLAFEGGLLDDRNRTGELSNHGVSLKTFPELGPEGIINLTVNEAITIYYSGTPPAPGVPKPFGWLHLDFDLWPAPLSGKCFDMTVNPGAGHGLAVLNAALQIQSHGWKDPALLTAVRAADTEKLLADIRFGLGNYYRAQVEAGHVPAAYLAGLLRRAAS